MFNFGFLFYSIWFFLHAVSSISLLHLTIVLYCSFLVFDSSSLAKIFSSFLSVPFRLLCWLSFLYTFHMTFTPLSPLIESTGCCARPFIIKFEGNLCTPSAKWDNSQLFSVNRLNLLSLSYLNIASPGTPDYLSNDDSFWQDG